MKYLLLVRVDEALAAGVEVTDPEPWIAAVGTRRLEGHQLRGPGDAPLRPHSLRGGEGWMSQARCWNFSR